MLHARTRVLYIISYCLYLYYYIFLYIAIVYKRIVVCVYIRALNLCKECKPAFHSVNYGVRDV